jgi:hypothetical protein
MTGPVSLRERIKNYDLQELQGAEFLRLLRLAHTEGRLDAVLQEIGARGLPHRQRIACGLSWLKSWFR